MVKIVIKPTDIKMGVKRSQISGHHKNKEDKVNVDVRIKHNKKKVHFKPEEMDEGDFDSRNPDRRGLKNKLNYRGDTPYYWRKDEFRPDSAGGRGIDSGFSRGGDFNPKPLASRLYQAGVFGDTENINKPNPFPIKMNRLEINEIKSK